MFKNPFSFEGRIRRSEYGLTYLFYFIPAVIINLIITEAEGAVLFLALLYIPLMWFMWAQGAKRCHDRGNSGWFQLIPFYGLWMLFGDSDRGINQYGHNPKGIGNEEATLSI